MYCSGRTVLFWWKANECLRTVPFSIEGLKVVGLWKCNHFWSFMTFEHGSFFKGLCCTVLGRNLNCTPSLKIKNGNQNSNPDSLKSLLFFLCYLSYYSGECWNDETLSRANVLKRSFHPFMISSKISYRYWRSAFLFRYIRGFCDPRLSLLVCKPSLYNSCRSSTIAEPFNDSYLTQKAQLTWSDVISPVIVFALDILHRNCFCADRKSVV